MTKFVDNSNEIRKLARSILSAYKKRKRIMILAGAGISKSGGVPLFEDIIKFFHKECKKTGENNPNWEYLPEFKKLSNLDIDQLIKSSAWGNTVDWLKDAIDSSIPTKSHEIISSLCDEGYVDYIFSLNYDNLFEKVSNEKIEVITTPKVFDKFQEEEPKVRPHLIKVHGDVSMLICRNCGYTSESKQFYEISRCQECNELSLTPYILLPDSAKSHGENFIRKFKERANYFDIIISVGFSGKYDSHVIEMLKYFRKKKVTICNINPDAKASFGSDIIIPSEADDVFSKLKAELINLRKESLDLEYKPSYYFDSIYKRVNLTDIEKHICSNEAFLRLRGIHQLGLKYCKYISANHSRFEHSIGTMKVANEMYLRLKCIDREGILKSDNRRNAEELQFLRLAALLHDIGHIWFGHIGEEVVDEVWGKPPHENFLELVIDEYFIDLLSDYSDIYTKDDLIWLIQGKSGIKVLEKIIKSTFDADKIEYLLRDSRMTGKDFGIEVDKDTLFDNLVVDDEGELYIYESAISALERIAEARYHMYKEVYFDFEVRCYESLFKRALVKWIRYKELDSKKFDDPELFKFLLKKDEEILQEMESDLKEIEKNERISEARKNFFINVLNIIKGTSQLPPGVLYELTNIRKPEDEMKNIFNKIDQFNKDDRFKDFVVIDTQYFSPYRKNEDTSPILTIDKNSKLRKASLIELSPFINSFRKDEFNIYVIRMWFMFDDDHKKATLTDEIENFLNNQNINYRVKTW